MMNEAPGPINFTMFLTLFGERLQGTDPEDVIKNAFGCFDEDNSGFLSEDRLRELLTTMGDRFTDEDVSIEENVIFLCLVQTFFQFELSHIDVDFVVVNLKPTLKLDFFLEFQVDEMYREAPIKNNLFDYIEFTRILKHGAKDKDEQ